MGQFLIFCALQACNSLTMMGLSLITPFFPPFAYDMGVDYITLGLIISANPIGNLIASLVLGKTITSVYVIIYIIKKNRFHYIIIGIFIQGLGLFSYVILNWINDKILFIVIATLGRGIGGIGTAFFMTPFFAYIPILFPDQIEKKVAEAEFISGLAQLIGPVFGSLLFGVGGYTIPFFVFGTLDLLLVPILYKILFTKVQQERLFAMNHSLIPTDQHMDSEFNEEVPEQKISYIKAFLQYQIMMQFLMVFICNVCFTYFQPIIAIFYKDAFQIQGDYVGYLMSLVTAGYTVGTLLCSRVKEQKRLMVFLGCFVQGGSYIIIGPYKTITGLDHRLWLTLFSQFSMGLATPAIYLPSIPLLNEILASLYPAQKLEIANISSAIFTSGMSIGQLAGPIIAGWVTNIVGFEASCAYLGLFIIGSGLVYFPMLFLKQRLDQVQEEKVGIHLVRTSVKIEKINRASRSTHKESEIEEPFSSGKIH